MINNLNEADRIYVLNPDYILKNDINRIILYSKRELKYGGRRCLKFIHPLHAMIFSFFTHERTLKENITELSLSIGKDISSTQALVAMFIENEKSLVVKWGEVNISFPPHVLIDSDKITDSEIKYRNLSIEDFMCESPLDLTTSRINSVPMHYTFMLTNKCVTKCMYCYADIDTIVKNKLPTSRIIELIRESVAEGITNINLLGGEVFLHKDWDIILDELIKNGYAPDILSTKVPLTPEMISRLKEIKFTNPIQFSFDANDPAILCELLKVKPDYCQKIKDCLELMDQSGLRYSVATVLNRLNGTEEVLEELFGFLRTLKNIESWSIRPAINSLYKMNMDKIKLPGSRIEDLFRYTEERLKPQANVPIRMEESLLNKTFYESEGGSKSFKGAKCSALNSHMFILPDGKVTICEQLYWNPRFIIGDVTDQSIVEVWNSQRTQELAHLKREQIRKESRCNSCKTFENCFNIDRNRCWADILKAYGTDNWDFPDPRCNKAPRMISHIGIR